LRDADDVARLLSAPFDGNLGAGNAKLGFGCDVDGGSGAFRVSAGVASGSSPPRGWFVFPLAELPSSCPNVGVGCSLEFSDGAES
jgi:hypothetical protein